MNRELLLKQPKSVQAKETLARMLDAARKLFSEKGYHNTTINDITREAGVATGTLYVYFKDKHDIYEYLLKQCGHDIRIHLRNAMRSCQTRREAEEVGMRAWLEFVSENPYVYKLIWESFYVDRRLFIEYYEEFCDAYRRNIDGAKGTGEISSEIDSEVLAYALMGAASFLGLNWGLIKGDLTDFSYVACNYKDILTDGIFAKMSTISKIPDG